MFFISVFQKTNLIVLNYEVLSNFWNKIIPCKAMLNCKPTQKNNANYLKIAFLKKLQKSLAYTVNI